MNISRALALFPLFLTVLVLSGGARAEKLRMACYPAYFPWSESDKGGEVDGVLPELWHLWSEKSGIEITFVPITLAKSLEAIEAGDVDAHCGMFYSADRADRVQFTDMILRMRTVEFVRNDIDRSRLIESSPPFTVVKDDVALALLQKKYPGRRMRLVNSFQQLGVEIHQKRPMAFVYDWPAAMPGFKSWKAPEGYYEAATLTTDRLRAVVARENTALMDQINRGLAAISEEELWELSERWSFYKKEEQPIVLLISISAISVSLLFAALIVIVKLRRKIRRRQSRVPGDWKELIAQGESDLVEFKSSLRYDYVQKSANKVLEQVIAKTISAYLNAKGGRLFIGVDDKGNVLGLENDYRSLSRKQNADGFLLALTSVINNGIGRQFHRFVTAEIATVDDKEICVVTVSPADRPAFFSGSGKEEFYIRAQASSQPLGLRETHEYIVSRFKK